MLEHAIKIPKISPSAQYARVQNSIEYAASLASFTG